MGFFTLLKLKWALKSKSDSTREAAVKALGATHAAAAAEPLITLLNDPSPLVRRTVATTLGQLGDLHAVEPLLRTLRDQKPGMRKAVATALGQLGDARAVAPLVQCLHDKDPETRLAVETALVKLGVAAVDPLIALLQEQDNSVRQAALRVLAGIHDPRSAAPLVQMLNAGANDLRLVAQALESMGWQPSTAVERVRFAFAHGRYDEPVTEGETHVAPLVEILKDRNTDNRRAAAAALGKIGNRRATPHLLVILADDSSEVREAAARALGQLRDEQAVAGLVALLNDDNQEVLEAAAAALGAIGDPQAIEPLILATRQDDHRVRTAALAALGQYDDPRTTEPLMLALRDKRYDVRKAAMQALIKLGSSVIPVMESALLDTEPQVRRAAATILRHLAEPESVWMLMRALHDENPGVRREVLGALGRLGDPQTLDAIANRIQDEDCEVQLAAVHALGDLHDLRGVPFLLTSAHDDTMLHAVLDALYAIMQAHAADMDTEDLQAIAALRVPENVEEPQAGALAASAHTEAKDYSRVTQLACRLLQERGVTV